MNSAIQLSLKQQLGLDCRSVVNDYLAVATTYNDFVSRYSSDCFYAFCARVDIERKGLVFDLKRKQVAAFRACEEVLLAILAEGHAGVVSHYCSCVYEVRSSLPCNWVELPKSHFSLSCNCELVIRGVPSFVVLGHPSPSEARRGVSKHRRDDRERTNNVSVLSIPDKQFAVECVARTQKQPVVVREGQSRYLVVMFRQSENSFFLIEVPNYNVTVFS